VDCDRGAGVPSGLPRDSKPKHGRIQRIHHAHRGGIKEKQKRNGRQYDP
jgi:S1/P1 Nuclease